MREQYYYDAGDNNFADVYYTAGPVLTVHPGNLAVDATGKWLENAGTI